MEDKVPLTNKEITNTVKKSGIKNVKRYQRFVCPTRRETVWVKRWSRIHLINESAAALTLPSMGDLENPAYRMKRPNRLKTTGNNTISQVGCNGKI